MSADQNFREVRHWLSDPMRMLKAGLAIRLAIDWVIDGARTRRYSIDQLQTSEKTYIGNRVEHELLHQWGLVKQATAPFTFARHSCDLSADADR